MIKKNKYSKRFAGDISEDCGIFPFDKKQNLIQTVDFFTPIVDSPKLFGQISAANSLSDIYAMGGKPLFALNVAAFPEDLSPLILAEILTGAEDIANEAGIPILGGHTIKDKEPKYGLVVTGIIDKDNMKTNSAAKVGDSIIITKPIGTGILSTALKQEIINESDFKEAINSMKTLNKLASEIIMKSKSNACTDITGFGLLGHLLEICNASSVSADISFANVPFFKRVASLAKDNIVPGGTKKNLEFVQKHINNSINIKDFELYMLADAQTSGGLLVTIPNDQSKVLINELIQNNIAACEIGRIKKRKENAISII